MSAAGAGFFAHQSDNLWDDRRWGHVDHVQLDHVLQSSRGFVSVLGPLQTVQRAELWGVILALQSSDAVHVGVDNLGVVRHVGRLLNGHHGSTPVELVTDGDLLVLIDRMLHLRGHDTVRITKVKGHADHSVVLDGRVRELDKLGNDAADEAADFGRRRVGPAVIGARRDLSGVCSRWCPVIFDLHRFFIAFCRAVVHHDGNDGTALDPTWFGLPVLCLRGDGWFMLCVTLPCCLGHLLFGLVNGLMVLLLVLGAEDVPHWPYTPGLLVKWVAFEVPCIGLLVGRILGLVVFSYVELLILYELWAGERLTLEKAHPQYLRPGRPISVSAVPFGPGIDIWRSCRFIGALMRSLCLLPGGLSRSLPCAIGANHRQASSYWLGKEWSWTYLETS